MLLHYIVYTSLSYFLPTAMLDYAAAPFDIAIGPLPNPSVCALFAFPPSEVSTVSQHVSFLPQSKLFAWFSGTGPITWDSWFIYQFCDTLERSSRGECLLLTLSAVITRASDLLCRISSRVARRHGASPGEDLSWLVSSLICLCCRAQYFTRRCWSSYFALLLYYSCTSWRCGEVVHLVFLS